MLRKVFVGAVLIFAFTVLVGGSVLASNDVTVMVNGVRIQDDVAQIMDGRTMVGLRAVFEALGFAIDWNQQVSMGTLTRGSTVVRVTSGDPAILVNNVRNYPDVPPQIVNGRFIVPVRAVAELTGATVDWDGATRTVRITAEGVAAPRPTTPLNAGGRLWNDFNGSTWSRWQDEPFSEGFYGIYFARNLDDPTWNSDRVRAQYIVPSTRVTESRTMNDRIVGIRRTDTPNVAREFFNEQDAFSIVEERADGTVVVRNNLGNTFHMNLNPRDNLVNVGRPGAGCVVTQLLRSFNPDIDNVLFFHLMTQGTSGNDIIENGVSSAFRRVFIGGIVRLERVSLDSSGNRVTENLGYLPLTDSGHLEILNPGCYGNYEILGYNITLVRAPQGYSAANARAIGTTFNELVALAPRHNEILDLRSIPQSYRNALMDDTIFAGRQGANGTYTVFTQAVMRSMDREGIRGHHLEERYLDGSRDAPSVGHAWHMQIFPEAGVRLIGSYR
jgi:hypothetical protein